MAEQPFLFFPRPALAKRAKLGSGVGKFQKPTPAEQRQRLDAKFQQIADSFRNVQTTIGGIEPEQVVILETVSASIDNVAKAAAEVPGLEWLAERELEEVEPEFGFQNEKEPEARLPCRLYALLSNQEAMDALIGLWRRWIQDPTKRADTGFGPFKNLFIHLRDIRRWGPQDRIAETGILASWREDIDVKGTQGTILFEIDLWFRSDPAKRQRVFDEVNGIITESGGRCLDSAAISDICYHGVLAELPAAVVEETIKQIATQEYSRLLRSEGIMFFRPQAQSRSALLPPQPMTFDIDRRLQGQPDAGGSPVIAVLDGVPVGNHRALRGRILIDDPDDYSQLYQAGEQHHGTAIASLILHGDLNGNGPTLKTPIYVRPVLHPDPFRRDEKTPPNKLLVDLIHRAVRRIFDGEGDDPPAAPTVRVINFSIGNLSQPFDREMSPLGRLLDWLSWKHKVLFVVSIGNCASDVVIEAEAQNWPQLSDDELVSQVLRALKRDQHKRRPLSPAEGINCLSVGAVHADEGGDYVLGPRVDLLKGKRLPSPLSTVSNGFRRSTKPEILLPGGRQLYSPPTLANTEPAAFRVAALANAPGHLAAAPGLTPMETGRVGHSCGTSNATALASRCAALVHEKIQEFELPNDCDPLNDAHVALLLKTMLVHGASWGDAAPLLEQVFEKDGLDWRQRDRLLQQFLGYGEVQIERCLSSTTQRATLLGWASISEGEAHIFRLPLPPSLSASKELRRLTATLAWCSPTNQQHKNYRRAQLFLKLPEGEIGAKRIGIASKSAQRGTVEHRIFEGSDAKAFLDDATLSVQVNCKKDGGKLNEAVPYAIAVSLEIGSGVEIDIYQEVSVRLRPQVQVPAAMAQ
jgi:hypothetical protein